MEVRKTPILTIESSFCYFGIIFKVLSFKAFKKSKISNFTKKKDYFSIIFSLVIIFDEHFCSVL